jgi:hypothetical protein
MNNIFVISKPWSQSSDLFSTAATAALTSEAAPAAVSAAAAAAAVSTSAAAASAAAATASAATQLLRSSRPKSANQAFRLRIGIQQSLKGRSHEILISFFIVCVRPELGQRSCHSFLVLIGNDTNCKDDS